MPYNPYPTAFRTRNWRELYESYILDLSTLRSRAKGAVIVIIDAEPWRFDDSKPAELGLSLVPPLNDVNIGIPGTLEALSHSLQLETHWLLITARERQEKHREPPRFGQRHELEDHQVEQTISDLIRSFTHRHHCSQPHGAHSEPGVPIILAGFSVDFELQILSKIYPRVLRHFTSWLDLQEIAASEAAANAASRRLCPGLHQTLAACGFKDGVGGSRTQHNAATDTVRAAALFAYFMSMHDGERQPLSIPPSSRRPHHCKRNRQLPSTPEQKPLWNGTRPTPKELYPYIARVSRAGADLDLGTRALLDLFTAYEPVAVGISKGKRYGWVCLRDIDALGRFVQAVDGSSLDDGHAWKAVSDHDPTTVPAQSLREAKEIHRRLMDAEAENKRALRRAKKDGDDDDDDVQYYLA